MFWGAPIALDIVVSIVQGWGWISLWLAGVLWADATFWIGMSCLVNVRRCSRTHCLIAGILLLPIGAAGPTNVLGLVSFSWSIFGVYWDAFYAVLAAGFLAEYLWGPYQRMSDACGPTPLETEIEVPDQPLTCNISAMRAGSIACPSPREKITEEDD